ncbi:single-strand selective monofunctional uracil DNA glycosylase-like isoform X1 [Artemia franciscana]
MAAAFTEQHLLPVTKTVGQLVLTIEKELAGSLLGLNYSDSGVTHIYNPVDYARVPHEIFVTKFCKETISTLLIGMNPGPWGMVQTGVPFGEVSIVRDWLNIIGEVIKPANEHPKRPILGFQCHRSEISGKRFWAFLRDLSGTPERLFETLFMYNYCPLSFMKISGKNVTPPELKLTERKILLSLCDAALLEVIKVLRPKSLLCVGNFVFKQVSGVVKKANLDVKVGLLMHPSPINPRANKNWAEEAKKTFDQLGISGYFSNLHDVTDA